MKVGKFRQSPLSLDRIIQKGVCKLKKNKSKSNSFTKNNSQIHGLVFASPLIIGIIFIFIWVLVDSIRFSFGSLKLNQTGFDISYIGLGNYYESLFVNPTFVRTVINSLLSMLANIPVTIIFSLFIAVLLNQKMAGRTFFRAIFFVPVILAVGFVEKAALGDIMLNALTNGSAQASQQSATSTFSGMNFESYLQNLSFSPTIISFVVGLVDGITGIVNQSGVQILIFLAGLQSISPSVYESASIEGATQWESFWKITLPLIVPIIFVNSIYTVIDYFTKSTNPIMTLIYEMAFKNSKYAVAAAMSWIYFIVIAIAIGVVLGSLYWISNRKIND